MCQNAAGLTADHRSTEGLFNVIQIIAVNFIKIKAKSTQFCGQIAKAHYLIIAAVDLQAVVVNDNGEIIQLIVIGCHKGFPDLAFLAFAVAQNCIDLGILAQLLCTQCHANSNGTALAQRARGRIHARNLFAVRMALQDAVKLAEIRKFIAADESQFR